jgi:hypothetical protein
LEPRHLFAEAGDFFREDDGCFRLGSDQVFYLGQPPACVTAAA